MPTQPPSYPTSSEHNKTDPDALLELLEALQPAGLRCVEITLDSASCFALMTRIRARFANLIVGAGTVLREAEVEQAAAAGAQFLVSPHGSRDLAEAARALAVPYVPAAFTPTEIVTAWGWGVPLIKVFPVATLGTGFLKQLRGPLPAIPLVVTGGVTMENALEYRQAGADAVGMGSELIRRWQAGGSAERAALIARVADLIQSLE